LIGEIKWVQLVWDFRSPCIRKPEL
jgi:hypothetical protein